MIAEAREIRSGEENIHPFQRFFLDFFERAGEKSPGEQGTVAARELGKASTEGWLLRDGTLKGVILAGLGEGFIAMKELGDIWKEYGRENFPLDPFTRRGRGAMRSKFREVINAFKQIGP